MAFDLITGFPGFIGRRLVMRLLDEDEGARLVVLVEKRMLDYAREAVAAIDAERIAVLEGDIADRRLGLSDDDYERLRSEVRRV
nr:SDR family oxidoreductase [Thermoleophilaceae bacterium]